MFSISRTNLLDISPLFVFPTKLRLLVSRPNPSQAIIDPSSITTMRSHLRLHLPNLSDLNLNLVIPSLCHSPTTSFSYSYLSRSSSTSTSRSSSASSVPDKPELVCPPSPITAIILSSWYKYDWANSSDALTDWLNARWKKSGYVVDRRVVHFLIKMDGVGDVSMELGDVMGGAFGRPLRVRGE